MDIPWDALGRALIGAAPAFAAIAGLPQGPGRRRQLAIRDSKGNRVD